MSLRNRLWLVVGALVLVPLVVGALVAVLLVSRAADTQVREVLQAEAAAVSALLAGECERAGLAARSLGAEATAGEPAAAAGNVVSAGLVDYAALLGPDRTVLAEAGRAGPELARQVNCSEGEPSGDVIVARVPVDAPAAGAPTAALAAVRVDADEVAEIAATLPSSSTVTLLGAGDSVVASTASPELAATLATTLATRADGGDAGPFQLDRWIAEVGQPQRGVPFTVVVADAREDTSAIRQSVLAALLFVTALTLVLGWHLARQLTRPLAELTAAAERVAGGDLDQTIAVRRGDETGRLAESFNRMIRELRRNMSALSRSRDDLRESVERLGGALGSTHDLGGLLKIVLDTAVVTTGATVGAAWAADGAGPMQLVATHGPEAELPDRLVAGSGADLLARAVDSGELVREGPRVAVPLLRGPRVVGLLGLEMPAETSRQGRLLDVDTDDVLRALAGQAGVAVDNVLLHREAQRLSITDPLTGLWNFRYLSMSLSREIERATRFDRPLAVLMMDIDHFKPVNDTYGHARGDAVLRELASRVSEQIREVDTLARYGGEEFVLVLPETTLEGASRLAERICTAVRREPFDEDGEPALKVTVSVGIAGFPQHGASAATLMRAADGALYVAKNGGRDRWHLADS